MPSGSVLAPFKRWRWTAFAVVLLAGATLIFSAIGEPHTQMRIAAASTPLVAKQVENGSSSAQKPVFNLSELGDPVVSTSDVVKVDAASAELESAPAGVSPLPAPPSKTPPDVLIIIVDVSYLRFRLHLPWKWKCCRLLGASEKLL
jgi:hypothetical protein